MLTCNHSPGMMSIAGLYYCFLCKHERLSAKLITPLTHDHKFWACLDPFRAPHCLNGFEVSHATNGINVPVDDFIYRQRLRGMKKKENSKKQDHYGNTSDSYCFL